ncbi:hypothetical protein [Bifidobacterium cuniculi]|uniref:hypothetical protein n=1 Tax=Bifidobacterium cuniculi TaxID=1688 RepID=UPI001269DA34|nr:hypothetical protein [Bifidobacterium cuniculi]
MKSEDLTVAVIGNPSAAKGAGAKYGTRVFELLGQAGHDHGFTAIEPATTTHCASHATAGTTATASWWWAARTSRSAWWRWAGATISPTDSTCP